jgi:hypothetical protein
MVKTTRSPQQRRHSSTRYTPRKWCGGATLPGARRGGGSPRRVSRERESSLANPHGSPAATEKKRNKIKTSCKKQKVWFKKKVSLGKLFIRSQNLKSETDPFQICLMS